MLQFDVVNGKQPALNDFFRSHDVVQMGKEPYRSFFDTFHNKEEALKKDSEQQWIYSLNGKWHFKFCDDIHEDITGMEKVDYDDSDWDYIKVPSCWQGEGYDMPMYSSCMTPFQPVKELLCPPEVVDGPNSMGIYRHSFEVPKHFLGRQTLIRFEGVESCLKLWVNGYQVGFSQNSFAPSEFNITQYLQEGKNVICCQVYRWCATSHLEAQDMWRVSGIFRNVSLISEPDVSILDFHVQTILDEEYKNAQLKVMVKVSNKTRMKAGPHYAEMEIYDANLNLVGNSPLATGFTGSENPDWPVNTWRNWPKDPKYIFANSIRTVYLSGKVENPLKWSAETPNLYTLLVTLKDEEGKVVQVARKKIGFRSVEAKQGQICVNGKPILLKGTNYHEFSPVGLRALTEEEMIKDILLMKRHNINAVRNAHYPHQAKWYDLCDEYGLYIMDEGNLETHDTSYKDDVLPGNDLRYTFACIDRVSAMVLVSKNSPSVIIWSMGNECGYGQNIALMAAYCRTIDGTRLIHKRQMNSIADMDSDTYPGVDWIIERAMNNPNKPFILNEYAHAMGNAMGNLQDYWEAIEKYPCLCGAFIWEWCDHGIATKDAQGKNIFAYGTDYPTEVNTGNFCIDGVVTPDRQITSKLLEVKATHQYIKLKAVDIVKGVVEVFNGYGHINLKNIIGTWNIIRNNIIIAQGDFGTLDIEPGQWKTYQLPYDLSSEDKDGEFFFNASFTLGEDTIWANEGYEIAATQLQIPIGGRSKKSRIKVDKSMNVTKNQDGVIATNDIFTCEFSFEQGTFTKLEYEGKDILCGKDFKQVFDLQVYRAPTNNDFHSPSGRGENGWLKLNLNNLKRKVQSSKLMNVDEHHCLVNTFITYMISEDTGFHYYGIYDIAASGEIRMNQLIQPYGNMNTLPRIGIRMICDKSLDTIRWFGRGPGESYPDRKAAALIGDYTGSVSEQNECYVVPQETGNKEDVRFLVLTDKDGRGIHIMGDALFSFSALNYTANDFKETMHDGQLIPREETILSLDYGQNGLGNSSCGGDVMEKYRLQPLETYFNIGISYYKDSTDPYEIATKFDDIPSIDEVFLVDHSISIQSEKREVRRPFDPSDAEERKKAGFEV